MLLGERRCKMRPALGPGLAGQRESLKPNPRQIALTPRLLQLRAALVADRGGDPTDFVTEGAVGFLQATEAEPCSQDGPQACDTLRRQPSSIQLSLVAPVCKKLNPTPSCRLYLLGVLAQEPVEVQ